MDRGSNSLVMRLRLGALLDNETPSKKVLGVGFLVGLSRLTAN
jgi:hypothetical protein